MSTKTSHRRRVRQAERHVRRTEVLVAPEALEAAMCELRSSLFAEPLPDNVVRIDSKRGRR